MKQRSKGCLLVFIEGLLSMCCSTRRLGCRPLEAITHGYGVDGRCFDEGDTNPTRALLGQLGLSPVRRPPTNEDCSNSFDRRFGRGGVVYEAVENLSLRVPR